MNSYIKSLAFACKRYKRHRSHGRLARRLRGQVESQNGKVSANDLRRSNEYAKEVLGSLRYSPWLHLYSAVAGGFREGWIPDNYYEDHVVPKMKGLYGEISMARGLSPSIFGAEHFPDVLYHANGLLLDPSGKVVDPAELVAYLVPEGETRPLIFKEDGSDQGRGIRVLRRDEFQEGFRFDRNGVIQEFIDQHEWFRYSGSDAVATLRLTTVVSQLGLVDCRAAYLRVGGAGDKFVMSESAIRIPIDLASGRPLEFGYLPDWSRERVTFLKGPVPHFVDAVSVVEELHARLRACRAIGWDVAIGIDGKVHVMEWNGLHNDIKFSEATQGPCFQGLGWEDLWKE